MKKFRPYLIGGVIGALALAALPLTGVFDHRASGGAPLTGWYQWLANRQSVTLRSIAALPPDLSDPAKAARAAGHYEIVCAACHGSPAGPPELFAQALSPPAPSLAAADRWRPAARLYQTVKYGIHGTAMPGWPVTSRDDEVWDMVAFLTKLSDLDAEAYRAAAGTGSCRDCHGAQGEGRDGIPRLDIHTPEYIAAALRDFRAGSRASGTMMAVTRRLSDADIADLSRAFGKELALGTGTGRETATPVETGSATGLGSLVPESSIEVNPPGAAGGTKSESDPRPSAVTSKTSASAEDPPPANGSDYPGQADTRPASAAPVDQVSREDFPDERSALVAISAKEIFQQGDRTRDIPACLSCHGVGARPEHPRLAGQDASYLKRQLELFSDLGLERGGSRAHVMAPIAQALTPEMIEALADYLGR